MQRMLVVVFVTVCCIMFPVSSLYVKCPILFLYMPVCLSACLRLVPILYYIYIYIYIYI